MKSFSLFSLLILTLITPQLSSSQEIVNTTYTQQVFEPGFEIIIPEPKPEPAQIYIPTTPTVLINVPPVVQEETIPEDFVSSFHAECSPNKTAAEPGEEVTWSYLATGVTNVVWQGETLDGATEPFLTTIYNETGRKNVSIVVTPTVGKKQTISCASVEITQPPLLLECSVSKKVIAPNECIDWSLDVETSNPNYSIQWSGHNAIQAQRNQEFSTCYSEEGYYLADATVSSGDQKRTIYCGSVFVTNDKNIPDERLIRKPTKGFLIPGKLLEGYCSADKEKAFVGENVTWTAHINQDFESRAFSWHGNSMFEGNTGIRQNVKYAFPQTERASFILTTETGESYNFPCDGSVEVIQNSESATMPTGITAWIRLILLWGVIGFWTIVAGYTIKVKFFKK